MTQNGDSVIEQNHFRILDGDGQLTKESIKNFLKPPYPPSYLFNVLIVILATILITLTYYGYIPTHHQGFFCNDPLFSHKYTGNTITPTILAVGELALIIFVIFLENYMRVKSFKEVFAIRSWAESYYYIKYFFLGITMVEFATEIAKGIVGEHRPDFFDMCKPDTNINCTYGEYVWRFTCTNTDNFGTVDLVDVSRSFPSGHASISWFTAMYCAYVIHTSVPARSTGSMFKILTMGMCIMWAMMCSLSRITDRRHHWWDVLFGTIMGLMGAVYMAKITNKKLIQIRRIHYQQTFNRQKESVDAVNLEESNLV